MFHELQGDENQLTGRNRPKKDQSYTKLRSIMLVSVSPVCNMVVRRRFELSAASDYRHCWCLQTCSSN